MAPQILPHKPILHCPVTRLPPEILAHVLELCIDRRDESMPVCFHAQRPSCFAQVCKLWKAVVESDPHLWTFIDLHFAHRSREDCEEDVSRAKFVIDLYLARSGALPISLTFIDHRLYHDATRDLISLLVDRLQTHSRRWKRILLDLPSDYFPQLCAFTPCDLSSLEHLYISGDVLGGHLAAPYLDLESAVNLKSFSYTGPGDSLDDTIDFQWERLAEVSFDFVPHDGIISTLARRFRYLARCQSLTTCSLGIEGAFSSGSDANQTIILPCLQTLRVRRLSPQSHACTVIDVLVLPQLQTLEIDAVVYEDREDWTPVWLNRNFSNLLTRSGCSLHHLSIQDVDFPNKELLRCLALSCTLKSFCFIPCPRSKDISDVIRKLDVFKTRTSTRPRRHGDDGQRKGPLVPALREITLGTSEEEYLDAMLAMLRSRSGSRARAARVAALRHVEVVFFDIPSDDSRNTTGRLSRFQRELVPWLFESGSWEKNESREEKLRSLRVGVVHSESYLEE